MTVPALAQSFADVRDWADYYIKRGLRVVPLEPGKKCPETPGWLKLIHKVSDFRPNDNVGFHLVGGLVDNDNDSKEAVALAPHFMPPTSAIYGRDSKPGSHRLYRVDGLDKPMVIKDLGAAANESTIAELRVNHQSMCPPSRHPSGEMVRWEVFEDISQLPAEDLTQAFKLLGTACLVARYYNPPGNRHDWGLALAGVLRFCKLTPDEAVKVFEHAGRYAGDSDIKDRLNGVKTTYGRSDFKWSGALKEAMPDKADVFLRSLFKIWNVREEADQRKVSVTFANTIKPEPVKWLWDGRLALGSFTLLAGREGIGKTTFAYTLAADITRGRLHGIHHGQPRTVLVAATEDSWAHTIVPRLMAADADLSRVGRVDVTRNGLPSALVLPHDNRELERIATEYDVALILLDPLISRLDSKLDTHKDAEVRSALEPLVQLADATKTVVLGIIHVNKGNSRDPLNMVMGSRAFTAVARAVLFVAEDPSDEEERGRVVGQPKNNLGRTDLPTLKFEIEDFVVGQSEDGDSIHTGKLTWMGDDDRSIREIVEQAAGAGRTQTVLKDATAWLKKFLEDKRGSALSSDVKACGEVVGYKESTLKRASKELDIISVSEPGSFPRRTWWTLPGVRLDFEGDGAPSSVRGGELP